MKLKSLMLMVVALSCGLVAMLGYQEALSSNRGPAEPMHDMLVAIAEIKPGTPLNDSNVKFKPMPVSAIPEGAVTDPKQYENRALMATAVPGETIMLAKLGEPGVFGVAGDIPEGMRLISVEVDATMSSGGLLQPGNRVDVMVTFRSANQRIGTEVMTVLEDIEVIAVDNRLEASSENGGSKSKTISLLVTPEEAMELKRAENMGKLHLMMRRPGDKTRNKHRPFSERLAGNDRPPLPGDGEEFDPDEGESDTELEEFLDRNQADTSAKKADETPAEPEQPAKKMWKVEIFSGDQKTIQEVELPEDEQPQASEPASVESAGAAGFWQTVTGVLQKL